MLGMILYTPEYSITWSTEHFSLKKYGVRSIFYEKLKQNPIFLVPANFRSPFPR